jgi:hypothetical protein
LLNINTRINMTQEQFNEAIYKIESEATRQKVELMKQYQKFQEGQIIFDEYDKMLIERVEYNTHYNDIAYYGKRYTKRGLSRQSRETYIWQKNAILASDQTQSE